MSEVMELAIDPGPQPGTFSVRVHRSLGSDQPTAIIELDVDAVVAALPALESSVLASSVSARRVMTERETAMQSIGARLFDAVFAGAIGTAYRASAAVAAERGRPLQIALRLDAPGLAAMPWEALFDPVTGTYLSRREPLVRWVPGAHEPQPAAFEPPLRILGMIAAPRGLPLLDVEGEQQRLDEALRSQVEAGRVELTWLADASWHGIQSALLSRPWHVLHFVGHGGYDVGTDEGMLALVGQDGRADFVSASRLADLLDEADPTPRLVVLNSCQSGAAGVTDLLSGTAAALVHSGIRAVAAMQFAITDGAAIAFSRAFYASLANGRPVGEAVRSGRIGILGISPETLEWVTPVLYLRGEDARLLDAAPLASAMPRAVPVAAAAPAAVAAEAPVATGASTPAPTSADPAAAEPAPPPVASAPAATAAAPPVTADAPPPATPPAPGPATAPPSRRRWAVAAGIGGAIVVLGAAALLLVPRLVGPPPAETAPTAPATASGTATPSSEAFAPVSLAVPLDQAWTATGVTCEPGDVLTMQASGIAMHGPAPDATASPDGLEEEWFHQFNVPGLPDANTAGLIGSLDREPDLFFVGSSAEYECPRAGELFLGINDIGLDGNSGSWDVIIDRVDAG